MTSLFDVAIVGAGPGGSNAAAVALKAGLRVAQVDRYTFPRVKPCAGGLTLKACGALRLDLQPALRAICTAFEFNVWANRTNTFTQRTPILKMVLRPEFDNLLVAQNRRCERFSFFDGERVLGITHDHDGVFHVETERRTISARQLIGADGAYSLTNRVFKIAQPKAVATAVEVTIDRAAATIDHAALPCFDFGAIDQGYGWIFPKDDHWNVGLYTYNTGIKDFRERLRHYIAAKGFTVTADPLATFAAHRLPVGGFRLRVPALPVYLVGDAGGYADAITGEGIYHALESGRLAGATAVRVAQGRGSHRAYYRRLWRSVLPDTLITYYISRKFYHNVDLALRILETPLVWRPFVQGYADGATVTKSIVRGGVYLAASLLEQSAHHERAHHERTAAEEGAPGHSGQDPAGYTGYTSAGHAAQGLEG